MDQFNVNKRKVLKFSEFGKKAELSSDAENIKRGEAPFTKEAMPGEADPSKDPKTLDNDGAKVEKGKHDIVKSNMSGPDNGKGGRSVLSENASKTEKIDFRLFIDYQIMNKKDFDKSYSEDVDNFEIVKAAIADIWSQSKLEMDIDGEELYPSISKKLKLKYPNLFIFGEDIGVPTLYVISSSLDLASLIEEPEGM